ncbi:MAG: lamin tail domain-containing protein [Patescibacteria group bacterium]
MHINIGRILVSVLIVLGCIFSFRIVSADVIINEIQISPIENRFIELYNSGSSSIDLTDWYIQRKTGTGTTFGSLVSKTNFENKTIEAGSYFLISRSAMSNSDIVLGSLTLTESNTIQIKNSSGEVVNKVGFGDANDCDGSCAPNPTENNSIQKISTDWVIASPTPGVQNSDSGGNVDENPDEEESDSNSSSDSVEDEVVIISVFKANILAPTLAFAEQPVEFDLDVKYGSQIHQVGRYFWNFGDGVSMEKIDGFEKFTHTYFYPGEYNVSLEYFKMTSLPTIPDAVDKMIIKVVPLTVSISNVGDSKDFFIELLNSASNKIDISKWIISSANNKFFTIPRNTVIAAKKSLIISGRVSGFTISDQVGLKLSMPNGEVVFDYDSKSIPVKKFIENSVGENINISSNSYQNQLESKSNLNLISEDLDKTNLVAAPILSKTEGFKFNSPIVIGLFSLLVGGGVATYFIRRKRSIVSASDDFEIIDE